MQWYALYILQILYYLVWVVKYEFRELSVKMES